jgi:hypothetical protein
MTVRSIEAGHQGSLVSAAAASSTCLMFWKSDTTAQIFVARFPGFYMLLLLLQLLF